MGRLSSYFDVIELMGQSKATLDSVSSNSATAAASGVDSRSTSMESLGSVAMNAKGKKSQQNDHSVLAIKKVLIVVKELQDATHEAVAAPTMSTLFHVAICGEVSMQHLMKLTGHASSTISRNVNALHEYGLVKHYTDPENYKQKLVKLTPHGKHLMGRIAETIQ